MSYNPLKPARPSLTYAIVLTLAAILLILLSLLPVPARAAIASPSTIPTLDLLPCLPKSVATTKYPSKHLYYRTNVAGQKCWTGGKPGAREAYAVRGVIQKATQSSQEPRPFTAQEWSTMEDDALTALCGQPCSLLMPFGDRWRLR